MSHTVNRTEEVGGGRDTKEGKQSGEYEAPASAQHYSLRTRAAPKTSSTTEPAKGKRKAPTKSEKEGGAPKKQKGRKKGKKVSFAEEEEQEQEQEQGQEEKKKEEETTSGKEEQTKEESKTKEKAKEEEEEHVPEILEKGQIYFLYRPRVNTAEVESMDDVGRFFVLLCPYHHNKKRLLVIGNKHLPHPSRHEKGYAVVETVSEDIKDIDKKHFEFDTYETKTRGEREEYPARPVGEGLYAIFQHHRSMRLAYVLELPERPGKVQEAFDIKDEGSFIFSVKNPLANETARHKDFPPEVLQALGGKEGRRWASIVNPDILDNEGIELFLVGAHHHLKDELGEEAKEIEEEASKTARRINISKLLRDLKMTKAEHPLAPLKLGQWA